MSRAPDDLTKTLRRVLKRCRKAETVAEVRPTPAEACAVREKLLPAAITYARTHERRLPAFVVLYGCRVFLKTTTWGVVLVLPDKDAVALIKSDEWWT